MILALILAQTSPTPAPPAPSPAVTAAPSPTATALPTASPTPAPTATPIAFTYIVDPPVPATGPGIREIAVTEQTLHAGGPWAMRVTTTSDVTVVSVELYSLHFNLFRVGDPGSGVFAAMGTVPQAPAQYLDRSYTVTVVGTTADGRRATANVSVRLAR